MSRRQQLLALAVAILVVVAGYLAFGNALAGSVGDEDSLTEQHASSALRIRGVGTEPNPREVPHGAAQDARQAMRDVLLVRDVAGQAVAGATIRMFNSEHELLAQRTTRSDGTIQRPRDLEYAGWSVEKKGHARIGVDPEVREAELPPLRHMLVQVINVAPALLEDYALSATVSYGEAAFPTEWARWHFHHTTKTLTEPLQNKGMQGGVLTLHASVPNPIDNEGAITIRGLHLRAQTSVVLAEVQLPRDEDAIWIDLKNCAYATNRSWLRVRVHAPEPVRYATLELRAVGGTERRRVHGRWPEHRAEFEFVLLGLLGGTYQPRLALSGMNFGCNASFPAFDLHGRKTLDLRPGQHKGTLLVRVHGFPANEKPSAASCVNITDARGRSPGSLRTGYDGATCRFSWLEPGEYRVHAQLRYLRSGYRKVTVTAGATPSITLVMREQTLLMLELAPAERTGNQTTPKRIGLNRSTLKLTWLDAGAETPRHRRFRRIRARAGRQRLRVPAGRYRLEGTLDGRVLNREFQVQGKQQTVKF